MSKILRLLSEHTGLHESIVRKIIATAPVRYKSYRIPKRSGGYREIAQPAREVKLLQRAFIETTLRNLPVHDAATAYRENTSILENAKRHAGDGPILKMDFSDFFPSITKNDWIKYCQHNRCITEDEDLELTSLLLFRKAKGTNILRLAIGAPSSPMLSNVLMFEFDRQISGAVSLDRVKYTRYADDLTFSAPRAGYLKNVQKNVVSIIKNLDYPKLRINHDKTTYITSKYHRSVTGLTLSNDSRVTIGRDRKRELSAAVHHASQGKLSLDRLQQLAGFLAFVNSVEPEFIDVLRRRYGANAVKEIQKTVLIGRRVSSPNEVE